MRRRMRRVRVMRIASKMEGGPVWSNCNLKASIAQSLEM